MTTTMAARSTTSQLARSRTLDMSGSSFISPRPLLIQMRPIQ